VQAKTLHCSFHHNKYLHKKKPIYVIARQKESCAVYGMPRSIVASGLTNQIEPVENVADAIIKSVGVK